MGKLEHSPSPLAVTWVTRHYIFYARPLRCSTRVVRTRLGGEMLGRPAGKQYDKVEGLDAYI